MTTFVHIADERDGLAIKRSGLRLPRVPEHLRGNRPLGVFAMPVVPDFMITHQWVRELKKRGFKVAVGVYFTVPDGEQVWAGLYQSDKQQVSAAQASAYLSRERTLGYEVIIPRSIAPSEIRGVRGLPQVVGWRHFPDAHRQGIFCGCQYCMRGQIKSRGIRARYEANAA
jgi:hypothetical protein